MATMAFQPGPGAQVVALWCDTLDEWDEMKSRCEDGTLTFDHQHLERRIDPASERHHRFLRLRFASPYVPPPLVLTFESVEVATRIGETGWYTFEGGLFRAEHLGEGRVVLDRVFEQEPPPQYHGHTLDRSSDDTAITFDRDEHRDAR